MVVTLALICFAFVILWIASSLVVVQTAQLSKIFHTSFFTSAFIILGILTSFPELSIGVNAAIEQKPDIFIGNLLGASFVLISLLIPLFAVVAGGIKLVHGFSQKTLAFALFTIILPAIISIDGSISKTESVMLIIVYAFLMISTGKHETITERITSHLIKPAQSKILYFSKILLGIALMAVASKILVDQTFLFTQRVNISIGLTSLLVFSIGTNLPELFVGIKSIMKKKREIALGHYVGSAATNTGLFGALVLTQQEQVINTTSFIFPSVMLMFSAIFLFTFARSKNTVNRTEGVILLLLYIIFVLVETQFITR